MKSSLWFTVVFAFVASTAFAAGLSDKKKWKAAEKDVKEKVTEAEKACGSKLKVTFEQDTFKGWNETLSLGGSCGNAAEGLGEMCSKDADNKAEGAKITSITCKAGETASLTVKGSSITYVMDLASGGWPSSKIAEELEKAL